MIKDLTPLQMTQALHKLVRDYAPAIMSSAHVQPEDWDQAARALAQAENALGLACEALAGAEPA